MEAAPSAPALPAPSAPPDPRPDAAPSAAASARAQRTRAFRAAVDLCRARLAATSSGKLASAVAVLVMVGALAVALSLRVNDGPAAPMGGLLRKTAGVLGWVCGGVLALAAARDASAADRADGIEALVAARGVGATLLRAARTLGATAQLTRTLGAPLVLVALVTAGLAGDVETALRRVLAAVALLAWAVVAAVTLSALAALAARLFRRRGPTALLLFVIGEKLAADALGLGAWSIPGALRAALSLLLGATGVGGGW